MSSDLDIHLHLPFDFVTKAISDLRDKMENIAKAIGKLSEERKNLFLFYFLKKNMFHLLNYVTLYK